MTQEQIRLVQDSWEYIGPKRAYSGELFYRNLFRLSPDLLQLLTWDIKEKGERLAIKISYIVQNLDRLDNISNELTRFAIRNNDNGVQPHHYSIMRQCLLSVLEQCATPHWNEQIWRAWEAAYQYVTGIMIDIQLNSGGLYQKSA